jgi:hypothetical protein
MKGGAAVKCARTSEYRMPGSINPWEVGLVAVAALVTLAILAALLYWVDQEWRERDTQDRPPAPPA